jgi:tetratricopeptide (TPR) repeat protein
LHRHKKLVAKDAPKLHFAPISSQPSFRAFKGWSIVFILALSGLGQIERDRGNLDTAQRNYADALTNCRSYGDPLLTAHTARHLGDIYRENRLAEQAEPLLTEAIAVYRQNLNTKILGLANAIRPLALLRTEQRKNDDARQLWSEARALYSALQLEAGISECSLQLGKLDDAM